MKYAALFVLFCGMAFGQTATVIELPKCDAETANKLYEAKQKADADWDKFSAEIGKKHDLPSFEFSKDFRFIVPTIPKAFTCSGWTCGNIMLTPATGNLGTLTVGN